MKVVQEAVNSWAGPQFSSAPPHGFDWPRLFRLQMAYLLLWSAVERYCALAHGPTLEPLRKIDALGADSAFREQLARVVKRTDRVYDSRSPDAHADLKPSNPSSSARYYYQVRSNLSHRGKGAWRDGEIVRQSLIELFTIFSAVLESTHVGSVSSPAHDEIAT
jgi:hypothetical protein